MEAMSIDKSITLVDFCQTHRTVMEMIVFLNKKSRNKFTKAALKESTR